MASISADENGRKRILFMAGDGTRKAIRLGKMSAKQANAYKVKVEALIPAANCGGSVDDEVTRWLDTLDDKAHARLAAVGLVKARQVSGANTLGTFIDAFIERQTDAKPNTLENMRQVKRWLVDCFGEGREIQTIAAADAEDFRAFMAKGKLGENTIRRHVGRARQLFKAAIRRGVYRRANPFDGMAATVRADKARQFFVTRDMADKVAAKCPDAQWRLLFALSRFGGLRCPSEHFALKWADVDWERNRIRVPSPKTAHHEGKDCRSIPIFPELRKPLMDVFTEAEPGTEHVITRYRDARQNLRTQLQRIIKKAGLEAWPKLWHNLRSTRQTELAETYPIHVVCAWLGNTRAVAQEHYLQITDSHFEMAIGSGDEKAAQNPAQHTSEMVGTGRKSAGDESEKTLENAVFSANSQEGDYPRQDSNL